MTLDYFLLTKVITSPINSIIMPNEIGNLQIRVRKETRRKLVAISEHKRWTLTETIDAIADAFMKEEKIQERHNKRPASMAS